MSEHDPWQLRDPAAAIAEVLRRRRPKPADVLVAQLQRADGTEQELIDVVRVHRGERPRRREASDLLRTHALALAGERPWGDGGWMPPRYVLVTVVCRSGRVVPVREELFWLTAWRYSNHNSNAFDGDVYLVTEHGWTGCLDQRAGFSPALGPSTRHLSVLSSSPRPTPTARRRRPGIT